MAPPLKDGHGVAGGAVRILVSASPGERRVALLRDGALDEAYVERAPRAGEVGDLHIGRIAARAPAISGAFVLLEGGASGFLPDAAGGAGVPEGTYLPVRVTRPAQGGKGPRLSAKDVPAGLPRAGPPRLVERGPDAALRLAAEHPDAAIEASGAPEVARLRGALGAARVRAVAEAFDGEVDAAFESLSDPVVALGGGARLIIQPTAALVAMDVDSGPAEPAAANAAAIVQGVRQAGLRHLAGVILLDAAGGSAASRAALLPALRRAASGDTRLRVLGVTGSGLLEMVRTRVHPPLHEILGQPPSALTLGLRALRQALREAAAAPGARPVLRAHPVVAAALRNHPEALRDYAAGATHPISLLEDPGVVPGEERIEGLA
ncbi:ribonuclease E/G [Roseomonas sp. CCTCC AB2023176]|uniref:ribonuclease E/G n=1 Tax=Roseomonas sp. CCTCC AB2023176 TaxID=3342640 RepID=UPI0035DF0926